MYTNELKQKLNQLQGIKKDKQTRIKSLQSDIDSLVLEENLLTQAINVAVKANYYIQERLRYCISSIVTKALGAIFDDPYTFELQFNVRGDKTLEVTPVLLRDGQEYDPMTACGGGVVDVISFALRLSCLLIAHPQTDKVLILDEPFKCVSRDLQPRVKEMLESLSKELNFQFLIVTHEEELEA